MGGRGASSHTANSKTAARTEERSSSTAAPKTTNTKFTTAQLNKMSRKQLELAAIAVFIKQNVARGLTAFEAERRAKLLMDGNSTPQLKKFIKRNG